MDQIQTDKTNSLSPVRCGIVLAGGEGKRLRPFVQQTCHTTLPKQYVSFFGACSLLENTYRRAGKLIPPKRLFTVVSAQHLRHLEVTRQLSDRPRETIVVQPENKETAPGLMLPLIHLFNRYPRSTVAVFPADHFILEEDRFMLYVYLAIRLVEKEPSRFVLLGIKPSRPEPEYGYILPGESLANGYPLGISLISSFIEKPNIRSAQDVIRRGGFWNTMVMIFNASALLARIRSMATALYKSFETISDAFGKPQFANITTEVYRRLEPMNFSKGLLQAFARDPRSGLTLLPVHGVHWSDWGSKRRVLSTLKQLKKNGVEGHPGTIAPMGLGHGDRAY